MDPKSEVPFGSDALTAACPNNASMPVHSKGPESAVQALL
jgi:hypothetical protein